MASIRERTRKDGTTSWAVLWRDADTGKQTSRTLATRADAQSLTDFLNANGQSFALAAQAASKMRSTAPPVATVVFDHIEGLTGVSAGTREKYRRIAARHITPHPRRHPGGHAHPHGRQQVGQRNDRGREDEEERALPALGRAHGCHRPRTGGRQRRQGRETPHG